MSQSRILAVFGPDEMLDAWEIADRAGQCLKTTRLNITAAVRAGKIVRSGWRKGPLKGAGSPRALYSVVADDAEVSG